MTSLLITQSNSGNHYNFKLPDAIIAATARFHNIPLFTADMELFKIKEIQIIEFYPERS